MAVMLGALLVLIMVVQLHALALMISLLGFYVVYLILEVLFLQRRVLEKGQR